MARYAKRGFALIVVLVLISLAVVLGTITTRYLLNLQHHVRDRQQTIGQRIVR